MQSQVNTAQQIYGQQNHVASNPLSMPIFQTENMKHLNRSGPQLPNTKQK